MGLAIPGLGGARGLGAFRAALRPLFTISCVGWLWLRWTNPPDLDLNSIRFYVVQAGGAGDTLQASPYFGRDSCGVDTECVAVIHPAARDSIRLSVPCFSTPTGWYVFCTALDSTGNESGPSNVVLKVTQ